MRPGWVPPGPGVSHERLLERAKLALEDLFGDTTVPKSRTVESLEEVQGEIETMIQSVRESSDKEES